MTLPGIFRRRSVRRSDLETEQNYESEIGEVDMSEFVVISAPIAAAAVAIPDREMALREKPSLSIKQREDELIQAVKVNDGRKSVVIRDLRYLADVLDKRQKGMNIAKTTSATGGIAGSVLAIVGLALTPVTLGASLGLTVAGITLGVASGSAGLGTEIADKVINDKALKKAQTAINEYSKQNKDMLQLMNSVREQSGEKRFRTFLEERLKIVSPKVYECVDREMQDESKSNGCYPEPAKAGFRAAAAAGKIASEILEAGGKAIKVGSLIFSVFTIPLDLHTIISNSIKIHKRTPSETAEYIRKLADELESGSQLDEKQELKRKAEKLEREVNRQKQQWLDSMEKIGEDVALKLEELAMLYDFVKKEAIRTQAVSLLSHMLVRPMVLILLPYLLASDRESWLYVGAFVSLVYDGVYLILNIAMEAYSYWIACQSNKEIEKGLYAARNLFNTAPQTVLSSAKEVSRSFHTFSKPELKNCSRYYNIFDVAVVALKTLLNFVILCRFGYLGDSLEDSEQPASLSILSYLFSWLCPFPLSESMVRLDLVIFWLAICTYLLVSAVKEHKENAQTLLVGDVINLGEDFRRSLKELLRDCNTDASQGPFLQSSLGQKCIT